MRFAKVNPAALDAWRSKSIDGNDLALLIWLWGEVDFSTGEAEISLSTIASGLGVSHRTAMRSRARLLSAGLIEVKARSGLTDSIRVVTGTPTSRVESTPDSNVTGDTGDRGDTRVTGDSRDRGPVTPVTGDPCHACQGSSSITDPSQIFSRGEDARARANTPTPPQPSPGPKSPSLDNLASAILSVETSDPSLAVVGQTWFRAWLADPASWGDAREIDSWPQPAIVYVLGRLRARAAELKQANRHYAPAWAAKDAKSWIGSWTPAGVAVPQNNRRSPVLVDDDYLDPEEAERQHVELMQQFEEIMAR